MVGAASLHLFFLPAEGKGDFPSLIHPNAVVEGEDGPCTPGDGLGASMELDLTWSPSSYAEAPLAASLP